MDLRDLVVVFLFCRRGDGEKEIRPTSGGSAAGLEKERTVRNNRKRYLTTIIILTPLVILMDFVDGDGGPGVFDFLFPIFK